MAQNVVLEQKAQEEDAAILKFPKGTEIIVNHSRFNPINRYN